jgi:maleamate amidohydrolase
MSDVSADYERAGFGRAVGLGARPAVLIVDMCRAYFDEASPLFAGVPKVVTSCQHLVAAARAAGVAVLWTRVEYEPGGANGGVWYRKVAALSCFDRGNPLGEWLDGLQPLDGDEVVTKQHASGFFGTDLADRLRRLDIDSVVIGGVSTSGCVRATATDASANGFVPIVVRQAVGDRNPAVHEANLFDLDAKYADVVDEQLVLDAFGVSGQFGAC